MKFRFPKMVLEKNFNSKRDLLMISYLIQFNDIATQSSSVTSNAKIYLSFQILIMIAICKSNIFLAYGIVIGICCGFVIRNYRALEIVKKCSFKPDMINKSIFHNVIPLQRTFTIRKVPSILDPFDIIDLKSNETIENSQTNFIFVGVMTAKNFLDGRATAVYHTWGKEVPGKIAFFSSEKSYSECRWKFCAQLCEHLN